MDPDVVAVLQDLGRRVEALERRLAAGAVEAAVRQRGWRPCQGATIGEALHITMPM
jgi:hypothetical protein